MSEQVYHLAAGLNCSKVGVAFVKWCAIETTEAFMVFAEELTTCEECKSAFAEAIAEGNLAPLNEALKVLDADLKATRTARAFQPVPPKGVQ